MTAQDVIQQYTETGMIIRETTFNGDYKKGNREWKKVVIIFKCLEKDKELAKKSLPLLFKNENIATRTSAAAHCISLGIYVNEAIKVLKESADESNGIFGFDAKMTLKVYYEQGYLKVYPTQKIECEKA